VLKAERIMFSYTDQGIHASFTARHNFSGALDKAYCHGTADPK